MKKILVFAVVTLFSISVFAQPVFDYNGIYYKPTSSTTVSVIANPDGTKYSGDITIPYTVKRGTIDFTVTSIADSAFFQCKELTSIDLPTSIAVIGKESFCGCRLLKSIKLPNITNVPYDAFCGCKELESVDISNVTTIDEFAFYSCSSLKSINIPNVITIGERAFVQCKSVERVDMPNVEIIESGAFSNCIYLKSVNMPKVTAIAEEAFYSCYRVVSIDIPNVTMIGYSAFGYCSYLQKVVLGNVDSIKKEAFSQCRSLDTFRITAAIPPVLEDDVFKDTPSDVLIQVPCGASSLYERVEGWNNFKNYEEWVPEVTVMSNDEKMGLVILDRQATCENPTAEMEAVPRSGYEFVKWSDESTENPRVVAVEDKDITLTAIFQKVGTDVENVGIEGVTIYSDGTVLHVEGAEKEYQIYSTTGSLLYRGTDAEVALPRGIYVVRYGNAIEKVVL